MKKIINYILILGLFCLSFIYTEKIANIVKKSDLIMKEIIDNTSNYEIAYVNAEINDNVITPGINGCTVDIDKSYKNMKKINKYNESLLKYKDLIPEITINNIYNKYIEKGNKHKREVSIVINAKSDITDINNIAVTNDTKINIFVDSTLINNNKLNIDKEYINIYNGGTNNNYDDVNVEWMNDVITDNYNNPKYCINMEKDDNNLLICNRYKMHTISPKIIVNNNLFESKKQIENGSIIYFKDTTNLTNIINYIKNKGYKIVFLDELLTEDACGRK